MDEPATAPGRRAVVLFPAADEIVDIEAIRTRWDPVMAARIPAHLTLVHDVTDHGRSAELLAASAADVAPFTVTLAGVARWGRARGVYLGVDDPTGTIDALHDALAPVERPGWLRHRFRPHLTVVHGRYVSEETAESAWSALEGWMVRREVRLDQIALVEMVPDGWVTIAELPFAGR